MKKRNVLIILSMLIVLVLVGCGGNETAKYELIERDRQDMGSFIRYSIRATTDEKLTKDEIEQLLKDIKEKEVSAPIKTDDVYVYLYDNELISYNMYTLGMLHIKDEEVEITAYNKDWEKQPEDEDYALYNKMVEKSEEELDEEKIFKEISEEENIELTEVKESINKVSNWMSLDVK